MTRQFLTVDLGKSRDATWRAASWRASLKAAA